MQFCSECGNLYDITDTLPEVSEESIDISPKSGGKSSKKKQIGGTTGKAYFVCVTCGNTEQIKPMTKLISRESADIAKDYFSNVNDPKNLINVPVLLRTRDYICPNKSCRTHIHPELRDAVMSRIGNSYKMQYVCSVCSTSWK